MVTLTRNDARHIWHEVDESGGFVPLARKSGGRMPVSAATTANTVAHRSHARSKARRRPFAGLHQRRNRDWRRNL